MTLKSSEFPASSPQPPSTSFEMVEMSTRIQIDETVTTSPTPDEIDGRRRPPAINNAYHSKKLTAEGMMDLSLLTANANQLKFIIYFNQHSKTFIIALGLIVTSLILQVVAGFLLIFRVSYLEWKRIWIFDEKSSHSSAFVHGHLLSFQQRRFKSTGEKQRVNSANEYLVLLIFLITVINILCAVLTTTEQQQDWRDVAAAADDDHDECETI